MLIQLGSGDLSVGFPKVSVQLWSIDRSLPEQFTGSLPAAPQLIELYKNWQSIYRNLCDRKQLRTIIEDDELEIDEAGITNISHVSFDTLCDQLSNALNEWLRSREFLEVDQKLRSRLQLDDEIRVIIGSSDQLLKRLPWHCWSFFQDYPYAEMALSQTEYQRNHQTQSNSHRQHSRILAILGNARGIDLEAEATFLKSLPNTEVSFLIHPTRETLNAALWDSQGWDILFFAGHSDSATETGRIYINENATYHSLTIAQLEEALKAAIDRGLQFAIFNSCDGLGLAFALERLQIPVVMVMREPVANRVAQVFFKQFLSAFAIERLPLYLAVRQARRQLQGLEDYFAGASWLPVICQNPAVEPPTWLQLGGHPPCPYRGLFAFQEADADVFFGRQSVTHQLMSMVKRHSIVAVVGASGSGKSSVVFAGLAPTLRSSRQWQIAAFRPGNNPFDALAEAVTPYIAPKDSNETELRLKCLDWSIRFQHSPEALCELLEYRVQQQPTTRLLLIADQFEELYTGCLEQDRQQLLAVLLNAVQFAPAFTLVLTLRADFYGEALSDRRFSDLLQGTLYNLGAMNQEELHAAIEQPAAQLQIKLEPGLTDKLIQATWEHPGHLPLLEFALTQLWSKQENGWLTHQAYAEIGGVEEALANHAETIYAQLDSHDRQRIQQVLMQLVQCEGGAGASRRLATRDDVRADNWDLVTRLASDRLVVTNRNESTQEETVEIVHETLIRNWDRFRHWIGIDREFRYWQENLRVARRQWESNDRDEDALLRGKLLSDAQYWYDHRQAQLSSLDRAFIETSMTAQKRSTRSRKRRRHLVMTGLTLTSLIAAIGAGVAWWGLQNATLSEIRAIQTSSGALFASNHRLDALLEALRARKKLARFAWRDDSLQQQIDAALRQAIYQANEQNRLSGHADKVYGVAVSSDGQWIATASADKTVKLWRFDGSFVKNLAFETDGVYNVTFSVDNQTIAASGLDGTVKLWKRDGTPLTAFKAHEDVVYRVALSPDQQQIATASRDGTIALWHLDGKLIRRIPNQGATGTVVYDIAFSPDGKRLASAQSDQTIKLWKTDGTLLKTLRGHTGQVYRVAFSPDGSTIASASEDDTIRLWTNEGKSSGILKGHEGNVYAVMFSPDGQTIASASWDKTVKLWKPDGTLINTFAGHDAEVWSVAFRPDNQTLVSASSDKTARLWRIHNGVTQKLVGHSKDVYGVAFSPDNQSIATASLDDSMRLWTIDGEPLKPLTTHTDEVFSVAFSPNSQMIASASGDKTVRLWNRDGSPRLTFNRHKFSIRAVAFSPDGQRIASGSGDLSVRLWRPDGSEIKQLTGFKNTVTGVAFSRDSSILAATGRDRMIRLWTRDGQPIRQFSNQNAEAYGIAISPRDSIRDAIIAIASGDSLIRLWKFDGRLVGILKGHEDRVNSVAFSPDGQTIVSGSFDGTVRLWKSDGTLLHTLNGHRGRVHGVAFSSDGQKLASAGEDKTVVIWQLDQVLDLNQLVARSCDWIRDYLRTNLALQQKDRELCNEIKLR